jgi:GT2 family glycosyltransferase/glycosyltransferase involved in cell wall biosynthesis
MPDVPETTRPVQLHVIHDLGGGAAKWLRDFAAADFGRANLVLRSFTIDRNAGGGLALYRSAADAEPLAMWKFAHEIPAVAVRHEEYRAVLAEIVRTHGVAAVIVSSLIGHSLDALETGLPTAVVCHDYFPYCPAINLYFERICEDCGAERLARCHDGNHDFDPFVGFTAAARADVRERYLGLVLRPQVRLVVPSRSVADNLVRLDSRFGQASITVIPHGYARPLQALPRPIPGDAERLRILILGQLSRAKGVELLREAMPALREFADVYLVGCGELADTFTFQDHVHVLSRYELDELPGHVAAINPHVAVLASIVAETFSYTLSELMMLGVPVAATRVGSFAERIEAGINGFLFEPDADALVSKLRELDARRDALARVRASLEGWKPRSAAEMVEDYARLLPVHGTLAPRTADRPPLREPLPDAREMALLADMWKEVKRLHVQLWSSGEARERAERGGAEASAQAERLARELHDARSMLAQRDSALLEGERRIEQLAALLHLRTAQLLELHASTSWKVSAPVRWIGRRLRRLRILGRVLRVLAQDRDAWPTHARELWRALRLGGVHGLKRALLGVLPNVDLRDAWTDYRRRFEAEVKPRIVEAIRGLVDRPLISVLVPTYETPEPMLRETIASVQAQLYPHWELCVADDGSTKPHVRRILEEAAAADSRVKVHFGPQNRGVSHASNRALELASGDFVVLLDHDDRLEEQALFRVAQAWNQDRPDMLYSDELLVRADGQSPKEVVYRPAFSPEFLRAHPYIVHLAGFRTQLLREIGGFDETLRVSQDYDLVLRASEKARTIVHIPEILYQWRVHGGSAGHQKMGQVMATSRAILERHLARSRVEGRIEPGAGFNFFDARYPLDASLRVAIVIPTRNHGAMLRQCIESLRATIKVAHDIVVIDHESDDPETLAYLASIREFATVLRYEGLFNFSAINNWAVAKLPANCSHILFCNNDIEAIRAGWLERMLELAQRRSTGIVGAKLYYPDRRTIQHAGVCVGAFRGAEHYAKFLTLPEHRLEPGYFGALVVDHEVAAVTAACMLVRRDAFEAVAGFDEAIAVGFGDVDLCLRIGEAGYAVLLCPHAELVHHESVTRGTSSHDTHPEDTAAFHRKWRRLLEAGDPYYSPGLSLASTTWSVKRPMHCAYEIRRRVAVWDEATRMHRIAWPQAGG